MKKLLSIIIFLMSILSFGVYAIQLTWDAVSNGVTINDGAGTWKNGVLTFNDGSTSVVWATGSDAIIGNGGAGGIITVSGTVIPNSILFLPVSSSYTLSGGIITLSNTNTIITTSGATSPIINSILSGTGGLTKLGSGTLTLGGTNTYTGDTTISKGKIIANNNSAFGLTGNIYVSSGAILDISGLNFIGQDNIFSRTTVATGGSVISSIQTIRYDFTSDTSGANPADILIDFKGSMKIGSITGLNGQGATISSASGSWPPIVPITLTKFPASTDYSVIWLQSSANTGYKNGVTLRAQPTTSPSANSGVRQGYLFQVSNYTNQLMFALVSNTGYNITIKNLSGALPNIPRRYKATVIGNTQTFSYSDVSNKGPWIVAIQKTFSNYASGGYTQYTDGWNYQTLNLAYIDDISMQYITSTTVVPDKLDTPSPIGIGSTSATFSFSESLSSGVTQYTLTANPGAITTTGTGSPLTLSGLSPSTTYAFTISAQNSAGSSTDSNPYTGITSSATTATISYSTTGATSGNVIATLTGLSGATITNNGGSNVYTFTGNGSFTFTYTQGASTGSAVAIVSWIDKTSPTATISYSTTGATSGNVIATLTGLSESISITNNGGSSARTFVNNGSFTFNFVDAVGNTGSTTAIVTWISNPMSLTITSPVQYQIIQRNKSTNKGSIQIIGTYSGSVSGIEASRNNGGFVNISATMNGGIFTGILPNQTGGQGTLIIRTTNNTEDVASVSTIGIGDIFIVAGQSNAAGRGGRAQLFTGSNGITATLFGNDYTWKVLTDPYDSNINQVDAVSLDSWVNGSFVPLLATKIVASQHIPVAFVPTAMGGTNISVWTPGTNHFDRTTLYGSMAYRIAQVGGKIAGVLFFQGESDVMMKRSTSSYQTALNTIINTLQSDFSSTGTIKWFIGSIGPDSYSGYALDAIRKAQQEIYLTNSYVYSTNALTYDINIADEGDSNLHFRSDGDLAAFSERWWNTISKEYYGLSVNTPPRILSTGAVLYTNNNSLILTFDTPIAEQIPSSYTNNLAGITYLTGSVSAFGISGGNVSVESVALYGTNSVILSLSGATSGATLYINYANANSGVNKAIYSTTSFQPAYPIYSMPITVSVGEEDIIDLPSSSSESAMNSTLISSGYTYGTGSIKTNLNTFLIGTKKIRTRDSLGKILSAIVMQSSGATNKIEAQIPAGTIVKSANNNMYTGILDTPTSIPLGTISLNNPIYAASFGSTGNTINFEDTNSNSIHVMLRIPVPGKNLGDSVDIYYSEDNGITWNFHTNTTVTLINGEPYAEFTTTHFTDFAVTLPGGGSSNGTFTINNDAASTSSSSVTLNIAGNGITNMRFSNDGTTRFARETFATIKTWTLPGTYGNKTIYAEFDTDDNTGTVEGSTSDSIDFAAGGGGSCAAGSSCGDLKLRIITGHSYCQYGTTLDFGTTGLSYTGRSLITGFVTTGGDTQRFCEDKQGLGTRGLTIQSSELVNISTNIAAQTIPASRVFIKNPAAYIPQGEGVCTFSSGDSLNQRVNLSGAKEILGKVSAVGEGCKIITDNLSIKVDLIAAQAIGQYSGTLTINVPNF